MTDFEKNLINELLDKFEKSKLSKEGTKINRKIKLTTNDKVLSAYTRSDSYKYSDENDKVIRELESLNFIDADFNYDTFKSLTLRIENVDSLYEYIGRENPKQELERIKEVLKKYEFDGFVKSFIDYVNDYIDSKFSYPKQYFIDSSQLDLILKAFDSLLKLDYEIKKRDFSVRYLGDSKLFESIQGKIIKIIRDFDSNDYATDDDILADYNIVRNTSYAMIKNCIVFKLGNQIIDLDKLGFEFSLSDEMIEALEIIETRFDKVITVENLTTFYSFNDCNALIVYLAGFHNHTKRDFLKKLYEKTKDKEYYHYSDIDAGGFWIFENLKEKTSIPFKPFRMGREELKENEGHLKALTENDKKRLESMLSDDRFIEFYETIEYMLENNVKLEQEILD